MQADDKEAQNHQINWETDIQAKMQIVTAMNISSKDIAHLDKWWNQVEVLVSSEKTLQSVNSDQIVSK